MSRNPINVDTLESILTDEEPNHWSVLAAHTAIAHDPGLELFASSRVRELICYARGGVSSSNSLYLFDQH